MRYLISNAPVSNVTVTQYRGQPVTYQLRDQRTSTRLKVEQPRKLPLFPAKAISFSVLQIVQSSYAFHTSPYSLGKGGSLSGTKWPGMRLTVRLYLVPKLKMKAAYSSTPSYLCTQTIFFTVYVLIHSNICLSVIHLMTFSVALNIWRRMLGWMVSN